MGAGAEVVVQGGHLMLKPLTPIPAMRRGFRLYPDDPDDPWVFRIYFPEFGMNFRVVFDSGPKDGTATRLLLDMMSFDRRPDFRQPETVADRRAGRRHGGTGDPERPAPTTSSSRAGHLIGLFRVRAPATNARGRLNQCAEVVARTRSEDVDVGIGIRIGDRHDVELPRVGQCANSKGLVPQEVQHVGTARSAARRRSRAGSADRVNQR